MSDIAAIAGKLQSCDKCHGTGLLDYAGFGMDPCPRCGSLQTAGHQLVSNPYRFGDTPPADALRDQLISKEML